MKMMMIKRALGSATRQIHALASMETIEPFSPTHVLSKEIIKPSSPTPSHLKTYRLSSMDQFTTRRYMPLLLAYPNHGRHNSPSKTTAEKSRSLKTSLTQTLTQYYPFAGRLTGGVSVDCNDQGVEFVEARINCGLSEVLQNPEHEAMDLVFPPGSVWGDPYKGSSSPVVVQLNHFDCGGTVMAVCMSHKIGDGLTFSNFLSYWAAVARQLGDQAVQAPPHFLPKTDDRVAEIEFDSKNCGVTRRFVFHNSKIAQLKAKVAAQGVQNPTRVQVLSALLFKSAVAAATENLGWFSPAMLFHFVNMRPKMAPPLPPTSVGNFYGNFTTLVRNQEEMELSLLSEQINKDKMQIKAGVEKLDGNEVWSQIGECVSNNAELYMCTSMCRFPFSQLDFGWGKPVKATLHELNAKNLFVLMDTPSGDGIEAIVNLEQERMATFERFLCLNLES